MESFALLITLLLLLCNVLDRDLKDHTEWLMNSMLLVNAALLACCIGTWILEGKPQYEKLDVALTAGGCGLGFPLAGFYIEYASRSISEHVPAPMLTVRILQGLCLLGLLLNIVSIFNGMYFTCPGGVYTRGPLFLLNQAFSAIILLPVSMLIIKYRVTLGRRNTISLLSYAILPLLVALTQFAVTGFTTMCLATTMSMLIIYVTIYVERGRRLAEKERQLTESRVAVMLSQIQPHFLYNALAVIQDICHGKAPDAEQATIEFAEFLRGNLDSLRAKTVIPFNQELKHTQNYLSLEKKRFGDRLTVIYEIGVSSFSVPALTIQPIVENSVRYGIMRRIGGGTVKVSTEERSTEYAIVISDDGVGFDVESVMQDGRTHIGIPNVRTRLETMCGGSLKIESAVGKGTTVVITIPK